ncbi:interferon-induced, double-stranded RNA-activated protein kinase-like [Littorina saxatilis]|uniref:interferon-induced, double-stranded RNA-activated protein kinase-like n=1 Tax=Littorina saxatilis TaxID=31220 RepID=UPI0038B687DB
MSFFLCLFQPANVFIVGHEGPLMIKIGDFGLCKLTQCQSQTPNPSNNAGVAGTYPYAAPEMLTVKDYKEEVDIYSLGIIYLELLVKIKTTQELVHIVKMVLKGDLPEELQGDEWVTQVGLLRRMLQKGAEDRSSATELLRSLFMSQPCSDEKVAFLERVIARKDAKIKKYRQKVQNAQEPVLQKLNLYKKKMLNEETSRDSTKDFQRALKRKSKEKKKVRSRHSSGQTAQAAPLRM